MTFTLPILFNNSILRTRRFNFEQTIYVVSILVSTQPDPLGAAGQAPRLSYSNISRIIQREKRPPNKTHCDQVGLLGFSLSLFLSFSLSLCTRSVTYRTEIIHCTLLSMCRPCGDPAANRRGALRTPPATGGAGGKPPATGGKPPAIKLKANIQTPLQPVSRFPTHFPFSHRFPVCL
jgi:hypothetical protein